MKTFFLKMRKKACNKYREMEIESIKEPVLYFCPVCGEPVTSENGIEKILENKEVTGYYAEPTYVEMQPSFDKPVVAVQLNDTKHTYYCTERCATTGEL